LLGFGSCDFNFEENFVPSARVIVKADFSKRGRGALPLTTPDDKSSTPSAKSAAPKMVSPFFRIINVRFAPFRLTRPSFLTIYYLLEFWGF
jgi:hypothetical protein